MKFLLSLLILSVSFCLQPALDAELVEDSGAVAWVEDGETVWRYSFDRVDGKPHFHPIRIPGGPELTKLKPADHTWHYGLWFSWKLINGFNYWEENSETGRSEGQTLWQDPSIEKLEDGRVIVRMRLDYVNPHGTVDLAEYRDLVVSPGARNGKYSIDWTSHFTAGPDGAFLDRTPLPHETDGKLWGGYGGLSIRLAHGEDAVAYESIEGPLEGFLDNRLRPQTQGVSATVFPNQRHAGSIAVLADPRNTRETHPWYLINGQPSRFLCAAVLVPQPVQLEAGEVWELSYRIVVRPKAWNSEDLAEELFSWLRR